MIDGAKKDGQFKNFYVHIGQQADSDIKLLPVGHGIKDDNLLDVSQVCAQDCLMAHRVPPALLGVVPNNVGGFGDVEKAAMVFYQNYIKRIQSVILQINQHTPSPVIQFNPYTLK